MSIAHAADLPVVIDITELPANDAGPSALTVWDLIAAVQDVVDESAMSTDEADALVCATLIGFGGSLAMLRNPAA